LGEGGVIPPPKGYLSAVRDICDRADVLLFFDEIQTGLARAGAWFAHHHEGVRPDGVCLAKALGNGFPVGACWLADRVAGAAQVGDHASTFGGQPLAMAAANAVLKEMKAMDAPRLAHLAGERLKLALSRLNGVAEVRGSGLLLGVELTSADSRTVAEAALERGLVVNAVTKSALRLAPPLIVKESEIDEAVEILASVIEGFGS
jgi:acetylornithine/N-succinyldiaminopimelate aminotransferase